MNQNEYLKRTFVVGRSRLPTNWVCQIETLRRSQEPETQHGVPPGWGGSSPHDGLWRRTPGRKEVTLGVPTRSPWSGPSARSGAARRDEARPDSGTGGRLRSARRPWRGVFQAAAEQRKPQVQYLRLHLVSVLYIRLIVRGRYYYAFQGICFETLANKKGLKN